MIDFEKRVEELRKASPLDIPSKVKEFELHDEKAAFEVFEELSTKFQKEDLIDNVINPSVCTVIDGVLAMPCFKGTTRKIGLSAQRIMNECKSFNYDGSLAFLMPDTQTLTDGCNASTGNGYLDIVDFIIQGCCNVEQNLRELYRRVAFNVCVSNSDDHFRNLPVVGHCRRHTT